MCGRYSFTTSLKAGEVVLPEGDAAINLAPRYNIAPSQYCPVIPQKDSRQIYLFRWGLIPFWAKDISIGYKMINARSETITEKSSYKSPFQKSRCLVLADSFYEWKGKGKTKQPFRILMRSRQPFYFAGLYSEWKSPEGNLIPSYTIITTEPNELVASIHNRMPVILAKDAALTWLTAGTEEIDLLNLLRPYPVEEMEAYPVSKAVGNVRNDTEELILPLEES